MYNKTNISLDSKKLMENSQKKCLNSFLLKNISIHKKSTFSKSLMDTSNTKSSSKTINQINSFTTRSKNLINLSINNNQHKQIKIKNLILYTVSGLDSSEDDYNKNTNKPSLIEGKKNIKLSLYDLKAINNNSPRCDVTKDTLKSEQTNLSYLVERFYEETIMRKDNEILKLKNELKKMKHIDKKYTDLLEKANNKKLSSKLSGFYKKDCYSSNKIKKTENNCALFIKDKSFRYVSSNASLNKMGRLNLVSNINFKASNDDRIYVLYNINKGEGQMNKNYDILLDSVMTRFKKIVEKYNN